MSNAIKQLAGQTAIYGFTTILGRLLNYLLVPIHTRVFLTAEFGTITEMFAYVSFLNVLLTYGMETAFFRFVQNKEESKKVFSTSLISLVATASIFLITVLILAKQIANYLKYPEHPEYIIWFAFILFIDTVCAIPFARLRSENKVKRFAIIKSINIGVNIGMNLFLILLIPTLFYSENKILSNFAALFYDGKVQVGYVFIANLLASSITLLLLLPSMLNIRFEFDVKLWKKMIIYALPLLVAGFAGIINETMDRILLKYLLPQDIALSELGIYGACYKVSIMMTIFIQAFRFASEPFFFSRAKDMDAKILYAKVMNYFTIACLLIFLGITLYMDIVKYFVGKEYYAGLHVIPILLLANMFLGIFFNLSIWYKLTGKTKFGAYLAIFGAIITLILNIIWIPRIGYLGSAWATLICYASMAVLSYYIGKKYYPVAYNTKKFAVYLSLSLALFFISNIYTHWDIVKFLINSFLMLVFIAGVVKIEKLNLQHVKLLIRKD